ncbi:MAG: hypothetical protein MK098_10495 [Marinovum sp.]|nr:hypothetical protein [Marinovum sp.]
MRALLIIACLACAPARAQSPVTWSDLIAPDRLARSVAQSAILTLRSFVDVTYRSLDVDIRRGAVRLRDIEAFPLMEANEYEPCEVKARRIDAAGAGLALEDDIEMVLRASDVRVLSSCFPKPLAASLEAAGITTLEIPRVLVDVSYHIPSAQAHVTGFVFADDLAEVTFELEFDYLWMDASDDEPYPVIFFSRATAAVRNLGVWSLVRNMVPPDAIDPETSPATLQIMASAVLSDGNAGDPFAVDFSTELAAAWSDFLREPDILTLDLHPEDPLFIDLDELEQEPGRLFAELNPSVSANTVTRVSPVSIDVLRKASDAPQSLSEAERLAVGRQLVTGQGVPRDVQMGLDLLAPLVAEGNSDVLEVLAHVSDDAIRADQYTVLAALGGDAPEVGTLLDALEARLGLAATLDQQPALGVPSFEGISGVADLRARALDYLYGNGVVRSYPRATYWAQLALATGDVVASDILSEIAELAVSEADKDAWNTLEQATRAQALQDWIAQDMPARLAAAQ